MLATALGKEKPVALTQLTSRVDDGEEDADSRLDSPLSPSNVTCERSEPNLSLFLGQSSGGRDGRCSADSLVILDELLDDIRRSRTGSLASTPTQLSSDCENESVILCDEGRRSEAELRGMSMLELCTLRDTLQQEVDCVSELLVRLLRVRDKKASWMSRQHHKLSSVLRNYAEQNGLPSDLEFSLTVPEEDCDFEKWVTAWKVLSRIPKGIPKHWRKVLWYGLANHGTRGKDWPRILPSVFMEYATPEDRNLGIQIVKDLHRTGDTGFTTEEEHAVLKRVLLAYARYNKSTGYCQGFNIIAALILKVMNFDEEEALKVMIYLIDYLLPENYFAHNLYTLSADMAAFRELLPHYLPELSDHMLALQQSASGPIRRSYSFDNPPDTESIRGYEPPLADVFTMQWFLTVFAMALPRKALRTVWDAIFLEGTEMLLYTGIAILAVNERELLQTVTTADFYSTMAKLGERLRKAQLLPSEEFIQVVYAIHSCAKDPKSTIPKIKDLREKYAYNIYPCAQPTAGFLTSEDKPIQCPLPSRGGSYLSGVKKSHLKSHKPPQHEWKANNQLSSGVHTSVERDKGGKESHSGALESLPMDVQLKELHKHYVQVARQPSSITCNMALAPPSARVVCPQMKVALSCNGPALGASTYAADVPPDILHLSSEQSGSKQLHSLHQRRRKIFTISFAQAGVQSTAASQPQTQLDLSNSKGLLQFVRHEYSRSRSASS